MKEEKVPPVSIDLCNLPSSAVRRGETLRAAIGLKNNTNQAQNLLAWFDVTSFDRAPLASHPFFKPMELHLEAGQTLRHEAYVLVPYSAAPDKYLLCFAVGPTEATKWDERFLEISVGFQKKRQENRCNLCGEEVKEDSLFWQDPSIRLAKCPSCGMVFDFDLEDEHSLMYEMSQVCTEGLAFSRNLPGIIDAFDRKNEIVLASEIERIGKEIPPDGKRLLDFGCGTGSLLMEARRVGFAVYGVETNEEAVAYAKKVKELPVFASMEEFGRVGGDDFLDVIVARHTVEHLPNPMRTLREFRKLLRPGGLLVIIVPHFSFVARRVLPNSMPRFSYGLIHKGHQYYFTKKTLARYLKCTDFSEMEFRYSILGGFLSRWTGEADSSRGAGKKWALTGASKTFSRLLHLARLNPVLTVYAK